MILAFPVQHFKCFLEFPKTLLLDQAGVIEVYVIVLDYLDHSGDVKA